MAATSSLTEITVSAATQSKIDETVKHEPAFKGPIPPYRPHAGEGSQYMRDFILGTVWLQLPPHRRPRSQTLCALL
jgi:hypothetical protein